MEELLMESQEPCFFFDFSVASLEASGGVVLGLLV